MSRIIIVEDDPMISEIFQRKFSESGFEVFLAESGKQALEIIAKEKINVVLSDLIMPEMGGFELTKTLRSGNYDPNIKIIIISNLIDSLENAIELGANGFLAKSAFTPTEMVNEVKKILDEPKAKVG
ncbi:MAG: response regulator [Parcubacteria group bacterium]